MLDVRECHPLVEWFCSSSASPWNLRVASSSCAPIFSESLHAWPTCSVTFYLFLPISIFFALSLICRTCVSNSVVRLSKRWFLIYNFALIGCCASALSALAFFAISVWLQVNRSSIVYFSVLSVLFLLLMMKIHSCRLQIQTSAQLCAEICHFIILSLLLCTQTIMVIKASSQTDAKVMLVVMLVLSYFIFVMLLGCFFAQIVIIFRRKSFMSTRNKLYTGDGSSLGYAENDVGIFTYLSIGWVAPLLNRGWYGYLTSVHDTFHLPRNIDIPKCADILEESLRNELTGSIEMNENKEDASAKNAVEGTQNENYDSNEEIVLVDRSNCRTGNKKDRHSFSVFGVFSRVYGWSLLPLLFLRVCSDACNLATPLLLNKFISFLSQEDASIYFGSIFGIGMVLLTLVGVVMDQMYEYQSWKLMVKIKAAFMVTIYRKIFQVQKMKVTMLCTLDCSY